MTSGARWIQGGHKVDIGEGRGPTAKTTHWIVHSSAVLQFWTDNLSVIQTTCTHLDR